MDDLKHVSHTDDLEARLNNWKITFKDKPHYQKAKSLEGNYKEPPLTKEMQELLKDQVFEAPPPARQPLNIGDAIIVERIVTMLPMKHKLVLVCQYMYPYLLVNSNFAKTCTNIGISRKSEVFDEYLKQSKNMVRNLLTRHTSKSTITTQSSIPVLK